MVHTTDLARGYDEMFPDLNHWVIETDCKFSSDALPVRWQVISGVTNLKPWKLTVRYVCCYGANCGPTAKP